MCVFGFLNKDISLILVSQSNKAAQVNVSVVQESEEKDILIAFSPPGITVFSDTSQRNLSQRKQSVRERIEKEAESGGGRLGVVVNSGK